MYIKTENASKIIFVVGSSRSGTTMMGRILGNHQDVFTFRELHFFEELWTLKNRYSIISWNESVKIAARLLCVQRNGYLKQSNPTNFYEEAKIIIKDRQSEQITSAQVFNAFLSYETAKNGKVFSCEQTPLNVFYIAEILELFPQARIINMIRDPRDVLLSQKNRWKRRFLGAKKIPLITVFRSWVNYHPITITKLWNASVNSANRYNNDSRVYSLRFEDLIIDPQRSVRCICDFLGITFHDNLLDVPLVGSSHRMDQPERKGIDIEAQGRWRKGGLTSTEVFLCQWMAGANMQLHGYNLAQARSTSLQLTFNVISFPIKLVLAFMLSLKRMKNIIVTIRKRLS